MGSARPVVCIVTPGTRTANNGNWRTAARWADMLRDRCRVIVQSRWDGTPVDGLIALHARRSAQSVCDFRSARPEGGLAVMLTGTDLYRDLPDSREAAESLDAADHIVVLQEAAPDLLQPKWRRKTRVIFQSARPLAPRAKARGRLDCIAVGHLREEKDPATIFAAVEALPCALPIRIRHIGNALDEALGQAATQLARRNPRYTYSGALSHGLVRSAIQRAHLLIHPSIMEGGANVIVEAVTSGTAVIGSRIPGNVGMLGADYPGYFAPRDASGLAALLVQAVEEPAFLRALEAGCRKRRTLFTPAAETAAVRRLLGDLLGRRAA